MIGELGVWFIFLLPLGSFLITGVLIRPWLGPESKLAGRLTILAIAGSVALSIWALASVANNHAAVEFEPHSWLTVANLDINVGIVLDGLTAIMLLVVTSVSLLVQVYSTAYMKGDGGYTRYFAYMSLFTASMIGLVISSNVVQMFVFWELVGASSYLLIGFWFHKPSATAAAKKAFIITRVGDFGFLLAILYLFFNADAFIAKGLNPLDVTDIHAAVAVGGVLTTAAAGWIAGGIFAGAVGKSGQVPLHTWLPDAMEGPTPVSALIHAATMVAAGVFLVARFFPVFESSEEVMRTVAIVGGVTAIFAATMGLVQNDIKRVLAYSTISQLGFMMLALGVGAYGAAIFHLFTHAFFKSLLFMGAGSVSHAAGGTFDMRYMGGLRRVMPWTWVAFLIGGLSLAGIAPMAGFWSKDEILGAAWAGSDWESNLVFWLGLVAAIMTAFYIFRALFMTFEGEYRGGAAADPNAPDPGTGGHGSSEPHESPKSMVWPIVLLALATAAVGWLVNPLTDFGFIPMHWFSEFITIGPSHELIEVHHTEVESFNRVLALVTSVLAVAAIALAYLMYVSKTISPDAVVGPVRRLYEVVVRKYYFDDLYEDVLTRNLFYSKLAFSLDWLDTNLVDGIVRTADRAGRNVGRAMAQLQNGQLQGYGTIISAGVLVIFGIYLVFR
jgi:NADH-quinone oxidoreductase subunit L